MIPGTIPLVRYTEPTLTYLTQISNASTTANADFGQVTATTPCLLIVTYAGIANNGLRTLNDASIGGTTVPLHVKIDSTNRQACIASRVVSSGTHNVTIRANTTSATNSFYLSAWMLTGYVSTTPVTASATNSAGATTASDLTVNVGAAQRVLLHALIGSTDAQTKSGYSTVAETTLGVRRHVFGRYDASATTNSKVFITNSATAIGRLTILGAWR